MGYAKPLRNPARLFQQHEFEKLELFGWAFPVRLGTFCLLRVLHGRLPTLCVLRVLQGSRIREPFSLSGLGFGDRVLY